ncbi:MAG: hypothetical protein F6K26_01965 [Moorea sp. SIO2I5]|nr:hypothetical protein [Moorena sp. SIO2I5]
MTVDCSRLCPKGLIFNLLTYPTPNAKGEQPTNLQPTNLQPTNLQPTNLQPANLQLTNLQLTNLQPANLQLVRAIPMRRSCPFRLASNI